MRKAIMIAGLVLALGVLAPATALGKAGGTDRPVQGSGSGTTVLDLPTLTFTADATGVMSHMGQTTYRFDNGVLTPTGPSTFDITISVTITAANGDQLFGDISGSGTNVAAGTPQARRPRRLPAAPGALRAPAEVLQRPVHPDADLHERHDVDLRHHVLAERHDQLLANPSRRHQREALVDEGLLRLVGGRCRFCAARYPVAF